MEAIVLVLNNLREAKINDMLMYLESMYMETETLVFVDYVNLTMVNKALYKFVNEIGFKCFKISQEDYLLYKVIVKHGYKALFHIDDLDLCSKFLQKFGYVYSDAVSSTSDGVMKRSNHGGWFCKYELGEYIHPKYLKLTNSDYYVNVCGLHSDRIEKECTHFGLKRFTSFGGVKHITYSSDTESPIYTAAKNYNIEKVRFLLSNSLPQEILKDRCLFKLCINIGVDSIPQYLLKNSIHKYDVNDLLKKAIRTANVFDITYLLNKKPDLHKVNKKGVLLIMYCWPIVTSLILEKMDLNVLYDGKNLLEYILCWNKRILDRRLLLSKFNDGYRKVKMHIKASENVSEEQNKILQYDLLVNDHIVEMVRTAFAMHQLNHQQFPDH